jgi:O-antigen/teichoic acid export membrane protein
MKITVVEKLFSRFSDSLYQAIIHSGWLFSDYILRFLVVAITTSAMARYLGPTNFGLLNYAMAFAAMIAFFTPLGMQGLQMSRFSKTESLKDDLSLFVSLRLIASVFATALTIFFAFFVVKDPVVRSMLFVLSFGTTFQVYETFESFFIAKNLIRPLVIFKLAPFLFFSILKILAVYLAQPLWVFALLQSLEFGGLLFILYYAFKRSQLTSLTFVFNFAKTKEVLQTTYPMIIVAAAVLIQTKLDQIIIGALVSQEGAGYYSAAYRLAELVNFIPIVIQSAVIGQVLQTYHRNEKTFEDNMQQLYRVMFIVMVLLCGAVSLLSPLLIALFFGKAFATAAFVLSILVWAKLFTSLRVVKEMFITAKGYYKYSMLSFLTGTLCNIVLNVLVYFMQGGLMWFAIVSVVTQAITFMSIDFFIREMRPHTKLTFGALATFWKIKVLFKGLES